MTYNEGWIEVFAGGAAEPLDSERTGLPRFGQLESRPGRGDYWVPFLQKWAQARGADIHYIDNCWLKVAVSAAGLRDFLKAIDQPDNTWIGPLLDRIDPRDTYLIEAEEF